MFSSCAGTPPRNVILVLKNVRTSVMTTTSSSHDIFLTCDSLFVFFHSITFVLCMWDSVQPQKMPCRCGDPQRFGGVPWFAGVSSRRKAAPLAAASHGSEGT